MKEVLLTVLETWTVLTSVAASTPSDTVAVARAVELMRTLTVTPIRAEEVGRLPRPRMWVLVPATRPTRWTTAVWREGTDSLPIVVDRGAAEVKDASAGVTRTATLPNSIAATAAPAAYLLRAEPAAGMLATVAARR